MKKVECHNWVQMLVKPALEIEMYLNLKNLIKFVNVNEVVVKKKCLSSPSKAQQNLLLEIDHNAVG